MAKYDTQIKCKNVFKNDENNLSKSLFTQLWIELINQYEKNKAVVLKTR